jgi:hypothetical protein
MTADIEAAFAAQASAGRAGAELDAGLSLALGRIATALERQRELDERMYRAIMIRPLLPLSQVPSGGVVTFTSVEHGLGPATGFAWAVQRLSAGGLGGSDALSVYRGPPVAAAASLDNFMNMLTVTASAWHPGRTGLILQEGETLVVKGTSLASTLVTLTGEVIQMEQWLLPHFLL